MNKLSIFTFSAIALMAACTGPDRKNLDNQNTQALSTASGSSFIPIDSANKMIGSYLQSVGYDGNTDSLLSLSVSAAELRQYLADTSIHNIKIMLAHRLDYINAGNDGVYCGYSPDGLTLVMAGYNAEGNYVLTEDNQVMDRMAPCPPICPIGDAASPTIIQPE